MRRHGDVKSQYRGLAQSTSNKIESISYHFTVLKKQERLGLAQSSLNNN